MNIEQSIRASAAEVFTPDGVDIWFDHPSRLLDGISPREASQSVDGVLRVNCMLEALKDGVFV